MNKILRKIRKIFYLNQIRLGPRFGRLLSVKSKSESLVKLFNEAMEGRTQRKFNELMAVALKKCGVTDAQAYYALVKEAEEQGIIRKAIHPDTKESWVVLNDDSVLPF